MQNFTKHIILFLIGAFLFPSNLGGQGEADLRIKYLNYEDGLVGRRATAAVQDSDGFMWIATIDALNRYDGRSFKHFNRSNSKLNYREVTVRALFEDKQGYLWLRYYDDIEFIHHRTFEVLTFEERFGEVGFEAIDIKYINTNSEGSVLIYLKNDKKYLYENSEIRSIAFGGNGFPEISNYGVFNYDKSNRQLSIYDFEGHLKRKNRSEAIPFHFAEGDSMYATQYNNTTNSIDFVVCKNEDCNVVSSLKIKKEERFHSYWLYRYDEKRQRFLAFNPDATQHNVKIIDIKSGRSFQTNLESQEVFLGTDNNGVLWIGYEDGIALVEYVQSPFTYYKDVVNARGIWANDEKMVVASSYVMDYIYDIDKPNQPTEFKINGGIHQIANDKKAFWAGRTGSFSKIDISTREILQTVQLKKIEDYGLIWAALQDSDGNWWLEQDIYKYKSDLYFYNPTEQDSADIFNQYNEFEALKNAFVIHFLEDDNMIWASSNMGIFCIDKQKGVTGLYNKGAEKDHNLPLQEVYWLYKDTNPERNLEFWAATNQNGLVKFTLNENLTVQSFEQFTTDDGLSSNVIYAVFEDDLGRLWMSTQSGITCFDKKTATFRTFTDTHGELPTNEFNRISAFQTESGRIYFGGVKGVVGFYPSDIDTASYDKKLLLSAADFFVGEQEKHIDQRSAILKNNKIVIEPSVRFATIEVALTDYFDAKDARYFYKIEGLHDDFRAMDGNSIQLINLPYGKYQLLFRGQAPDKRFSTSEISLELEVVRPFYLCWWFVLLVIAAVIGLFWLFYTWRVAQLRKRQMELEELVAQRTEKIRKDKATIEQQAEELEALDKLKDRFFANISHELRTPLTLILGPLGSLLKMHDNLTNKQFSYLNVIKRHTDYLMKRINEIMELNRLEVNKGQLDLHPVKLYDFLKVVVGTFESIAPQKDILFTFDYQMKKTAQILMDKDKFEHVIYNYLSNAFKYTPKSGKVKVTVKEFENKLRLEVQDTGIGIPKADIPNLFDRFYQAENSKKAGSSGIGLALCKEIVELLDGRVWAESEVGKGSTFFFEIPFEEYIGIVKQEELHSLEETDLIDLGNLIHPQEDGNKFTILLVEDNPDLRAYIRAILSTYYTVHTAENGREALDWLGNNQEPSLIISDIMMPVMDGLELLDNIKRSDNYRHISMIMLTARHSMDARLSALQLGVDDYITKPFYEQELLIRIRNLLKNQNERSSFFQSELGPKEKVSSSTNVVEGTQFTNLPAPFRMSAEDQRWLNELEVLVTAQLNNSQFTLTECARTFFLSERQLQRRIKRCTGLNFTKYLRLARLKQAKKLLESGDVFTVSEVAYRVGFETPAYFSKLFLQEFGRKAVSYFQK
jgi:signal transduction histidine kinase/DNA-binding response OmpR family regulator/ligand-binding sensor domain-containing protein